MAKKQRHTKDDNSLRASNIELFSREIIVSTSDEKGIYSRDADNLYPLRVEKIINNSPTARRCANLMAKYIAGNGNEVNFYVDKKKNISINDIIRNASTCISKQYGVYFKVSYELDGMAILDSEDNKPIFKRKTIEILDYVIMAKTKEDGNKYPGKYRALKIDEETSSIDTECEDIWFYPYNPDSKVILRQMHHDCKLKEIENPTIEQLIQNYRGQVYYMNLTPEYIYALPLVDSVYNDCDTEYRISTYNNTQTRTGFLGKTMIVKYREDEDSDDDFNDELKGFLGSENAANAFVVEVPQGIEVELEKAFKVIQLKPQFDDKLFEGTIRSLRQNIMGAFNNIPEPLVFAGQGAMFGTSEGTYTEMKIFYWEQNEYERSTLEQTLRMFGYDVNIKPIVEEQQTPEDNGL